MIAQRGPEDGVMQIALAWGRGGSRPRRVLCAGCAERFTAGLAGPGDTVTCPHCGDHVVVGARLARVLRTGRSRRPHGARWTIVAVGAALGAFALLHLQEVTAAFEFLDRELLQQLAWWW
jgi:hypothetical protein